MTLKTVSPPLRRFLPFILILILLPLLGCNLLNRITGDGGDTLDPAPDGDMSLEEAMEIEALDSRPTVLEEMGPPDAFKITFSKIDGEFVRWESWSYFDLTSQLDFIDGELLWAVDLEPIVNGSFFAHWYDPLDFQAGMSPAEATALFPEIEFGEIDTSALEVDGTLALAGEQILLGFDQDQLVYVETFILSPDSDAEPLEISEADSPPEQVPTQDAVAEEDQDDMLSFLQDKFDTENPYPVPIATDDFMTLEHVSGRGEITTLYEQSLMAAMYEEFSLDDFLLDVDIHFKDPKTGTKAGIMFRAEDPLDGMDHYYLVMVAPLEENLVLGTFSQVEWLRWDLVDIPADQISSTHDYHLSIDCQGDLIKVLLNGIELAKIEDSANPNPGFFGLTVAAYEVPNSAYFDNLMILEHP